jgi:hypothetical protein
MKKNLISVAVAASVLGGAAVQAAQHVSPDGTGQVLMFPFYNADNGNATNMHIVNTTSAVKALKVRFVEHKNSDEVLDFNVYLSGHDHFAFGVIKNPNGAGGAVITADNSCTVPALGSANGDFSGTATTNAAGSITRIQPFVNYQYAGGATPDFDSSIERTLTGHVEVIEMGEVGNTTPGNAGLPTPLESSQQYASFATHGATGTPANCAGLVAAWGGLGTWGGGKDPSKNITKPTGGLYGLAYHINVDSAAAFGFEPTVIDGFATFANHTDPGTEQPSITNGGLTSIVYMPTEATGYKALTVAAANATEAAGEAASAQAASAALMTASLSNDVMVNPAIGGMTDWVISFPTKKFHVDSKGTNPIAPFTDSWTGIAAGSTAGTYKEDAACEAVSITQWDREEKTTVSGLSFSPKPAGTTTKICNEVAVIAMGPAGTASALSVTTGLTNLVASYAEGWQRIAFPTQTMTAGGVKMDGLPAIGFGAYKVNNGAMSYGNAAEHKTDATNSTVS